MKRISVRDTAEEIHEYGITHLTHDLVTVSGVLDLLNNDWKVVEHNPQNMSVDISDGRGYFRKTVMTYHGVIDTEAATSNKENVAINANSSGNPRIDAVVLYVDISADADNEAENVLKVAVVEGTPASTPVPPNDSAIQSAVGAGNPFIRLAEVAVSNGASLITNANITDKRAGANFRLPYPYLRYSGGKIQFSNDGGATWKDLGSTSLIRGRVRSSGNNTLTTATKIDLTGATLTLNLAVDSYVDVIAIFDVQATAAGGTFNGFLNVDGVDETDYSVYRASTNNERGTVAMSWGLTLAAGTHTLKLRGRNETAVGQFDTSLGNTGFTYLVTSQ